MKKIEEGRRLLEALGESGLTPGAALWYYNVDRERWKLAISFPMADREGHLKTYEKIRSVMDQMRPPSGLVLSDIAVQGPRSSLIGGIKSVLRTRKRLVEDFKFIGLPIDNRHIGETYVYRTR